MLINLDYDSSVNAAPAQFKIALDAAVSYLDNLIANPITVTFQIGCCVHVHYFRWPRWRLNVHPQL